MSPKLDRRTLLAGPPALAVLGLTACGSEDEGPTLALDAPLPDEVPAGTVLVVGDPQNEVAYQKAGLTDELPFEIKWANISGGPKTQEAFRAESLDIGSVADIPPLHSNWNGLPTKIVAASYRKDPLEHPIYDLGIAPGADIASLEDLAGKRIAYSPGQAQGALVLRILDKAGLTQDDVELVELPSTEDTYSNALASGEVDAAPIGDTQVKSYVKKYTSDGATTIPHGLRDDPWLLYAPTEVIENEAKAAAIAAYVRLWGVARQWQRDNRDEWIQAYYVEREGLSFEDGEYLWERSGDPDFPADWSEAIAEHQKTIEIVAEAEGNEVLKAEDLYDQRFEGLSAAGLEEAGTS